MKNVEFQNLRSALNLFYQGVLNDFDLDYHYSLPKYFYFLLFFKNYENILHQFLYLEASDHGMLLNNPIKFIS